MVGLCSRQDCIWSHVLALWLLSCHCYQGRLFWEIWLACFIKTLRLIGLCGIAKYSVKLFVGFFSHRQRMNMIWQEDIFTSILTGTALRKSCRNFIQRKKHWHHAKDGSFKYTQYQRQDKSKQAILHMQMFLSCLPRYVAVRDKPLLSWLARSLPPKSDSKLLDVTSFILMSCQWFYGSHINVLSLPWIFLILATVFWKPIQAREDLCSHWQQWDNY